MARKVNLGQIVPNIQVGKTTTGLPGTNASVENVGTSLNPIFNFTIPQGSAGTTDYNELINKPIIPSKTSDLTNDSGFINNNVNNLSNYTKTSDLSDVATSGSYNDLSDKPTIPDVSNFITKDVNNLTNYTLKTSTGSIINLSIDSSTYVVTLQLKDIDGHVISTDTIDLPLETVVVGGRYDSVNKKVILTLQNGNTIEFSVADLVAGLQSEITSTNKLDSDLVDDSNSGNKFTNASEKETWNNKLDESDLTDYVKNTDYASDSTGGVIKTTNSYGTEMSSGQLRAKVRNYTNYLSGNDNLFISKGTLENVITGKDLTTKSYVDGLVGDINTALDTLNGEVI